ncbi:MAG: hypothetical protein J6T68_00105, partial [Candidatus Methanomethylophilaceae archaeon]|nr:hypothetical protein [Candidatus Methanomethylophilaceae archaeon]
VGWSASDAGTVCGYTTDHETYPKTAHDLLHHDAQAPTCTEDGWGEYDTCWYCDYTTKVTIPATGHNLEITDIHWVNDSEGNLTCTEMHLGCVNDGCTFTHVIDDGITVTPAMDVAPTCSSWGKNIYTARANYENVVYQDTYPVYDIEPLPHTYTDVETPATCTEMGYITHTCSVCGYVDVEYTAALGHEMHAHEDKAATCTEYGWTGYSTCEHDGCGYYERTEVEPLGHDLDHTDALEFTCTEDGNVEYWYCDRCQKYFADAESKVEIFAGQIAIAAHHVTQHHDAVAATCTSAGNVEYWHCTVCGNDYSDGACTVQIATTVVAALGHDMTCHPYTAPTCTSAGNELYYYCDRCQKYFGDENGNTETTLGEVTLDALGHDIVHHNAQTATCTEHGWDAYDSCSRCDYTTYQEIAALGHAFSATYEWSADGRTCTVHIVCANDAAHDHDIAATVSSAVKSPATYSAMGVTTYSVSGTYEGFAYADTKDVTDIVYQVKTDESGVKTYEESLAVNETKDVSELFSAAKMEEGKVEVVAETEAGALTIEFDNSAVSAIGASGNPVTIKANVIKQSAEVSDAELVIEVTLSEKFENGKAKVSVPFTEAVPEGKVVKVYYINGDVREDMNATLVNGKVVFETNHFSTYAVFFEDAPSSSGSNGGGFPIWIVFVIIAVVAAAGVGAFFVVKNKKA